MNRARKVIARLDLATRKRGGRIKAAAWLGVSPPVVSDYFRLAKKPDHTFMEGTIDRIEAYLDSLEDVANPPAGLSASGTQEGGTVPDEREQLIAQVASLDNDTAKDILRIVRRHLAQRWAERDPSGHTEDH